MPKFKGNKTNVLEYCFSVFVAQLFWIELL